ncbi:uncharacterized protein LOC121754487 [Salvia splendens]|uniref:uncharacterized protein LOC121754487 n=1 Tax=Salvia splendens TaxID=180675 RepID=UPI001C25D4C5|nr:uncharacterized protein LOC121754487 [Salvia splendens]
MYSPLQYYQFIIEIAQGASVGHSNDPSLSGDHPPLDNEEGESTTHNIEGDDTTSNSLNESGEEEPTHDARGRQFIHLRGKYLHPSGVVASICTYNFKQIVDPNGFSQKTLTEEYINLLRNLLIVRHMIKTSVRKLC